MVLRERPPDTRNTLQRTASQLCHARIKQTSQQFEVCICRFAAPKCCQPQCCQCKNSGGPYLAQSDFSRTLLRDL